MRTATHIAHLRAPRGAAASAPLTRDPDALAGFLADAAYLPGGHAAALVRPRNEAELAAALRSSGPFLPIGAQSSVTGGATPYGETLLSLQHFAQLELEGARVRAGAGVSLSDLRGYLEERGACFPPVPTFEGAQVGGAVSTGASGPATFKYGGVRGGVCALTVVLASGEVLDLERGQVRAHPDGCFELRGPAGTRRVPVPGYRMPPVPKCSAGYFAAPGMDLLDLFIGAEGTLGVITEVTLEVVRPLPRRCVALIPCPDEARALALTAALRALALEGRASGRPELPDVSAIEYLDARCLEVLRADGADRRCAVRLDRADGALLLVQLELSEAQAERALVDLESALGDGPPLGPLGRLARLLEAHALLERSELALPGDTRRAAQFLALREAVPSALNARLARLQGGGQPQLSKVGADMIVPFEHLPQALAIYRQGFEAAGLDYAVWGHVSDGNLHPNLIPHRPEDLEPARRAVLEFGRAVRALGGSPLAEHGVGRSAVKKRLLRDLYGNAGLEAMRAVKRALDPDWKLAPGNLFD
nr:FAD-binding oxidoreductase [Deinobacterium chartae]